MDSYLVYILKANLTLTLLFIIYFIWMRKETYITFNRFFLISIVITALIMPSIEFHLPGFLADSSIQNFALENYFVVQPENLMHLSNSKSQISENQQFVFNPVGYSFIIYLSGLILSFFLSIRRFTNLGRLLYKNKYQEYQGLKIITSDKNCSPFSFFNMILINRENLSDNEFDQIIAHEKIHYKQGHTIDPSEYLDFSTLSKKE